MVVLTRIYADACKYFEQYILQNYIRVKPQYLVGLSAISYYILI